MPGEFCPSWLQRWVVVIPAGRVHPYLSSEWAGALVVVSRGRLELVGGDGARHGFERGALLVLAGLALRGLWNPGPGEVELVALRRDRKRKDRFSRTQVSGDR